MSLTIGLGFGVQGGDIFRELQSLAAESGYEMHEGLEASDTSVRKGLEIASKHEGWEQLFFLRVPDDHGYLTAVGIYQELVDFECKGIHPKFFDFLDKIAGLAAGRLQKLGIFFASEWHEEDRIRYSYGSCERLKCLLSMPGYYGTRYLMPQTGCLQDCDETPFIFDMDLNS